MLIIPSRLKGGRCLSMRCARTGLLVLAGLQLTGPLTASELTGQWQGQYNCGVIQNNPFSMALETPADSESDLLEGEFRFAVPGQPGDQVGVFRLLGRFDQATGEFSFNPRQWIKRPRGYTALGFEGRVHDNGQFMEGRFGNGCGGFTAQRSDTPAALPLDLQVSPASGGEWQGTWEGHISCKRELQLPYRLTLAQHGNELMASYWLDWPRRRGVVQHHGIASGKVTADGQLALEHRMWLTKWRFGASLTLSNVVDRLEGSVEGLPVNQQCKSVRVQRVGTAQVPNVTGLPVQAGTWGGYMIDRGRRWKSVPPERWLGQLSYLTQVTLALDQVNETQVGIYAAAGPVDKPPLQQERYAYRLQPLTTLDDGRTLYVPLGIERAEGRYADLSERYQRDPFVILLAVDQQQRLQVTRRDRNRRELSFQLLPLEGAALVAVQRGEAPPVLLGKLNGRLAQLASLNQQCQALVDWATPLGNKDQLKRMTTSDIRVAALPLLADAVLEPLFGLPLMLTTAAERQTIYQLARACSHRTGDQRPFKVAGLFDQDYEYDQLQAEVMNRAESLRWFDSALAEISALDDVPASRTRLRALEGELTQREKELSAGQAEQLSRALTDKRHAVTLAEFEQRVAAIPHMAQEEATLVQLSLLLQEGDGLPLSVSLQQKLTRLAGAKAQQVLQPELGRARSVLAGSTRSLGSLATLTHHQRRLNQLSNTLPLRLRNSIDFAVVSELASRRRVLLELPEIKTELSRALLALEPGNTSPSNAVQGALVAYVSEQELAQLPALAARVASVIEQIELREIALHDGSTGRVPGEPGLRDMYFAVRVQLDQTNSNLKNLYRRCQQGDFQNDPLLAVSCLSIMVVGSEEQLHTRITRFEKLGCAPGQGQPGFVCDYILGFETGIPFIKDTILGDLMSTGEVSQGRFILVNDGWLFMPQRRSPRD